MAYAAKVNQDGIVEDVLKIPDEQAHRPTEYLNGLNLAGTWIQTSYNTKGGVHLNGGTPLRKNYAGPGYTYDSVRDAFIPAQCHEVAVLNEETCLWECTDASHVVILGEE